ncbi:PAC2 family protein [Corynebacterium pseudopelargi]|uniref:PAC2 family protein n=1 Tax=Corynebacterium pseudopelargi TaxID=2080757 RepID=A0A3G6ITX8_9CORY|nr:PAC2 family protein [Corynebacterium pseudopelargi]AZA09116.1 PAC2 family protein [Corynebacterium pseudopelargi]
MPQHGDRMYELEFPAPEVKGTAQQGPTLIVALDGYADAGLAVDASAQHLLSALDHRLVASFNNDELIDYRSRRPAVVIDNDTVDQAQPLDLGIQVLKDSEGKHFLLLSGPEPDLRWNAFTQAVGELVERFGVQHTICLYAAPMTVPHTRPLVVSAHGNDEKLVGKQFKLDSTITVPGSASLHLERHLHAKGHSVAGYTAHVPHYLAASGYPQATLSLLETITSTTGLRFPLGSLERDARKVAQQVEEQVAGSREIEAVVQQLEQQYDEELERYREQHPHAVLPGEQDVPSGEELGAEFEEFLAHLDDRSLGSADQDEDPEDQA